MMCKDWLQAHTAGECCDDCRWCDEDCPSESGQHLREDCPVNSVPQTERCCRADAPPGEFCCAPPARVQEFCEGQPHFTLTIPDGHDFWVDWPFGDGINSEIRIGIHESADDGGPPIVEIRLDDRDPWSLALWARGPAMAALGRALLGAAAVARHLGEDSDRVGA